MANNFPKTMARVRNCAPLLFFIAGIIGGATAHAQRIDKYYSSASQPNGTLYYILPAHGFNGGPIHLTYDITYLPSADSARLSFTYTATPDFAIDSVALILNGNSHVSVPAAKLFIDPAGRKFKYRYSAMLPYTALTGFFAQQQPPIIALSSATRHTDLRMKAKAWRKRAAINNRIFQLIALNRR